MSFMKPQVFFGAMWYVEGSTNPYPYEFFSASQVADEENCELEEVQKHTGWWSRLSAPGYMDATDWSGPFDTKNEAIEYLVELYDLEEEEVEGLRDENVETE